MIVVIELLVKSSIIDSRSRNNVDADPANFGLFCKSQDKTFLNNLVAKPLQCSHMKYLLFETLLA